MSSAEGPFGGVWRAVRSRFAQQSHAGPPADDLTDQELDDYLALLASKGWSVEASSSGAITFGESFSRRFPQVPKDYLRFLQRVASCVNRDETVWFLCADDYNGTSTAGWAWNEFEKMCLEGAEGDDEATKEVTDFWARHLPFLCSVGGEYAFLAFRLAGASYEAVVDGYELDLTNASEVTSSFAQFVRLHSAALEGRPGANVLGDYL